MKISEYFYKVAKKIQRVDSAGLFLPLPKHIAKYFPRKEEDTSPPHITILYFGSVPKEDRLSYKKVIEVALSKTKLGKVFLEDLKFFKNQSGQWIAHNPIRCEGLNDLRKRIWKGCEELGLEIHDSFPKYKPHATLDYLDQRKYDGDIFVGSFKPSTIEIWGFDQKISIPIK